MRIRKLLPVLAVSIVIGAGVLMTGCDKLITETINNTITDSSLAIGCFNCHSDNDNILLRPKGQWANSKHASGRLVDSASTCGPECHSHEGYISTFDGAAVTVGQYSAIGCFTCHAPHNENYTTLIDSSKQLLSQLRGADSLSKLANGSTYINKSDDQSRMCVNCHRAEDNQPFPLTLTAGWGPHYSGQADMFNASGGYWFAGVNTVTDRKHAVATEGTKDGCLACHYGKGDGYNFGEHTFRLENESSGAQYVANCNAGNTCHASGANGGTIDGFYTNQKIIKSDSLANALRGWLSSFNVFDSTGALNSNVTIDSNVAKSLYNYLFYIQEGSHGIHNPDYADSLLSQSILYMPVTASFAIDSVLIDTCDSIEVIFVNQSTGPIDSILWDFGDSSTILDTFPLDTFVTHAYNVRNAYSISLTAYGQLADSVDTLKMDSLIKLPSDAVLPKAAFGAVVDTLIPQLYHFTDNSLNAVSWLWNFGIADTSIVDTSTLQNPDYTFPAGTVTYTVELIAVNVCGDVDTTIQLINVSSKRSGTQAHLEAGRKE